MSNLAAPESDGSYSDTDTIYSGDDSESDEDREASDEEHDDRDGDNIVVVKNMQANSANRATKKSKKDGRADIEIDILYLLKSPPNTSLEEWYNTLKAKWTATESFALVMLYPQCKIEDQFRMLILDNCPVEVIPYPTKEQVFVISNALSSYDPEYDEHYTSKPQIAKMLLIGRSVQMSNVEVNGVNLHDEVTLFNTLPVPNKDDLDHFLSPCDARKYIENILTTEDLQKIIPTTI
eukprot:6132418-Ditylum_brightwellii.AAC.1